MFCWGFLRSWDLNLCIWRPFDSFCYWSYTLAFALAFLYLYLCALRSSFSVILSSILVPLNSNWSSTLSTYIWNYLSFWSNLWTLTSFGIKGTRSDGLSIFSSHLLRSDSLIYSYLELCFGDQDRWLIYACFDWYLVSLKNTYYWPFSDWWLTFSSSLIPTEIADVSVGLNIVSFGFYLLRA